MQGPHGINYAAEEQGDQWFNYCLICGVGLVTKHRAGKPDVGRQRRLGR